MDMKAFLRAKMEPRTVDITVQALAPWNDGVAPTVTVRGLTGQELARAVGAAKRDDSVGKLLEAVVGGTEKEQVKALREAMGIESDTPEDYAKRIEMMAIGVVSPAFPREACVKFAAAFPVEFYELTNEITRLTGLGHTLPGKPAPSTETAEFAQP